MQTVILKVPVREVVRVWIQATDAGVAASCLTHLRSNWGAGINAYNRQVVQRDLASCEFDSDDGRPNLGQEWGLSLLDFLRKQGYRLTTPPQVSFKGEEIIMCVYVLVKED